MKKMFFIVFLILVLLAGCSEEDELSPIQDVFPIHYVRYDIEDLCFKDTVLNYDFNNNQHDDFYSDLKWTIDTSTYNNYINIDFKHWFYDHLGSYSPTYFLGREWSVGDKVIKSNSENWISAAWGGHYHGTNNEADFNAYIDSLRNTEMYWGFYLKSNGKTHYGWLLRRCYLIEEFAINLTPEEPIFIGQREE